MSSGGLEGIPERYPATIGGETVPFTPADRPRLDSWMRSKILDRHGDAGASREKWPHKDKFTGWSDEQIVAAVDLALALPDRPPVRLGDKIRFERQIGDHLVRVQVRVDLHPPQIWNAYPVR